MFPDEPGLTSPVFIFSSLCSTREPLENSARIFVGQPPFLSLNQKCNSCDRNKWPNLILFYTSVPKTDKKFYEFLHRCARVGFCSYDLPSFDDLCTQADKNLFSKVINNSDYVLHCLLPPICDTSHNYSLRNVYVTEH